MNAFLAHLGDWNAANIDSATSQRRSVTELLRKLPTGDERDYFREVVARRFPTGRFNLWGVPDDPAAARSHEKTQPGDVVFIAPTTGNNGLVQFCGIVEAVPSIRCEKTSEILWKDGLFPYLLFLNAEIGVIPWYDFTVASGYAPSWNPHGYYVRLARFRHKNSSTPLPFLEYLRQKYHFKPVV